MALPIRARLAILASALVLALIAGLGLFVFLRLQADLLDAIDEGLRSRAAVVADELALGLDPDGRISDNGDMVAQLVARDGRVIASSENLVPGALLDPAVLAGIRDVRFVDVNLPMVEETVPGRLMVRPASDETVLIVGDSIEDQLDALAVLRFLLGIGGVIAVVLAGAVGWLIAGAALRPVDRMRIAADRISAADPGVRLPEPATRDELARLGSSLNAMLGRLEAALLRERRFVGDASHELRTPLANLKVEIDLALRQPRSPEELRTALESAAEETDRLARLAEDLLVLARAAGGRLPVRREDRDIGLLIRGVTDGFAPRAVASGIALEVIADDDTRALVDGDRIRQALTNLIDNALRHTPAGGRVTVELTRQRNEISLAVVDTGDGFPAEFLEHAFEPFSRADAARNREAGGTGLGLAIVHAVAEAHDGSVEAHDRPGGGSVVVLRIPV